MSERTLPRLDPNNRAYWTGGERGELMLHHCGDCDRYIHPPKPVCRYCLSENVAPKAVAKTGVVDTYTVNHQPWKPNMTVPFVLARVVLDEVPGVYLTTNVVGCDPSEVAIGDRVCMIFEQHDDVYLPMAQRVGGAE